jgi:hypothetical protein
MNEAIFDLADIRARLNEANLEDGPGDSFKKSIFIGTIINLLPSEKLYAPWSAISKEAIEADEAWFKKAINELASIGCCLEFGEGCSIDMYVCEYEDLNK